MAHIFISYSRSDRKRAEKLIGFLRKRHKVWYDVYFSAGELWWKEIRAEIAKADVFIYLMTPRSIGSPYCQAELEEARRLRKHIIPVRFKRFTIVPYFLAQFQYLNVIGNLNQRSVAPLLEEIAHKAANPPQNQVPLTDEPIAMPFVPLRDGPSWIVQSIVGFVLAIIGTVFAAWIIGEGQFSGLPFLSSAEDVPRVVQEASATPTPTFTPSATPTETLTPIPPAINLLNSQTPNSTPPAQASIAALRRTFTAEAEATARFLAPTQTQAAIQQQQTADAQATADQIVRLTADAEATQRLIGLTETRAAQFAQQTADAQATANRIAALTATQQLLAPTQTQRAFEIAQQTVAAANAQTAVSVETEVYNLLATEITHTPIPTPADPAASKLAAWEAIPVDARTNDDWQPEIRTIDGVQMVLVPPGCFMMGSDEQSDEQPVHRQCIEEAFWIDRTEVTNEAYGGPSSNSLCSSLSSADDQPRNCVDWFEATEHCEARGASLPTEAQWEYAARGPDALIYPWGDTFDGSLATYSGNSLGETTAIGSRPDGASWAGALDMSGNLWEWTSSLYVDYPYAANTHEGQTSGTDDRNRVLRGGSFNFTTSNLRAANRHGFRPGNILNNRGLRCARSYD